MPVSPPAGGSPLGTWRIVPLSRCTWPRDTANREFPRVGSETRNLRA